MTRMTLEDVIAHQTRVKARPGSGRPQGASSSKFRAVSSVDHEGRRHASGAEARRWAALQLQQRAGAIQDLKHQPSFDLVVNGQKVARYVGDASYFREGEFIVEDTKSAATKTPMYRLKFKLMKACHDITISEHMERT
jgi:hypothetical protein